jgi:toxin ParE1/3/4
MARLIWTEPALRDVKEIVAYIRKDSPAYAKRMGERLRQAPKQLKAFPRLGGMVPEFEQETLREILVDPYRIIYRVDDKDICYILAVVHGHRNLTRLLRPQS